VRRLPDRDVAWLENTQGLIESEEGKALAEQAVHVDPNLAIVEIGSHTGLSSCWLALGAMEGKGAHVTCVDPYPPPRPGSDDDPWELGPDGVLERFKENIAGTTQDVKRRSYWRQVTMLRATSEEVAAQWVQPIGLLFIDAIHTYAGVMADWTAWQRHAVDLVAFHDYGETYSGCREAIDAISRRESFRDVQVTGSLWLGRRA
jgi:hypothetical protein